MPRYLGDDITCGSYRPGQATPSQANAPELTAAYTETYTYDPAGNLRALAYGGAQAWTREYAVAGTARDQWTQAQTNQVTGMSVGQESLRFEYDANGNQTRQNSNRVLTWDHADRLTGFTDQASGSVSVEVRYLYGADGQRVKKWVRKSGAPAESTVYIDGLFEHHRWTEAGNAKENSWLHVMDGEQRVALLRRGEARVDDAGPAIQYVMSDHLLNSTVVVDAAGSWVNREEYFAYGETSFGGFAKKRYRFTGKERDEESGMNYHGARYYAPWLCRWTSTDPAGMKDGLNAYVYVNHEPTQRVDPSGAEGESASSTSSTSTSAASQPATHVILVGSDGTTSDDHGFHERVYDLLNTKTEARFQDRVKPGDNVVVLVPERMAPDVVRDLQVYGNIYKRQFMASHPGEAGVHFEIKKTTSDKVAQTVNGMHNIQTLYYFGHGTLDKPLFELGIPGHPQFSKPEEFSSRAFGPGAEAVWAGCFSANPSSSYAEGFARATGVTTYGSDYTTFYGRSANGISAGCMDGTACQMPSKIFMYRKHGADVEKLGPFDYSISKGTPILKPRNAPDRGAGHPTRDPFEPPWVMKASVPKAR